MFFGPFRFDEPNARVWRGAEAIMLTPKAFAVLRHLVLHPNRLVTKEELLETVWPKTIVTDAVLKVCIGEIRKALADDAKAPQVIETVHRRGYRFIGTVVSSQHAVGSRETEERQRAKGKNQKATIEDRSPIPDLRSLTPNTQRPAPSLVGREAELASLHGLLEKARSGQRQVVFVTGESGFGKTVLIEAFLTQVATQDKVRIARGQCLEQYGAGEAYLPVFEALGRLGKSADQDQFLTLLNRYAPTWLAQMPALMRQEDRQRLQREALSATPERMLREMAEAVEALTADTPLVLVLEDLHWSDYSTLDLLSALARRREAAQFLLISAYRPAEVEMGNHPLRNVKQELVAHGLCEEIALESLGMPAVKAYLADKFAGGAAVVDLAPFVHRHTGGHPLFMVNAVEHLIGQGAISLDGNTWSVTAKIDDVEIAAPESLQQIIVQRVERLKAQEQRTLEVASVVGGEFSAAAAAVALQTESAVIEEVCDELAQRGQFLRAAGIKEEPDGTVSARYQFVHCLYQQTLSERVGVARRLRLQRRIGEWVESVHADHVEEVAAELAMRFELSRDYERAVRYLLMAGENAMRKHAPREAVDYFSKGLRLLQTLPVTSQRELQELNLQMALGPALMAIHGYAAKEVEHTYLRARTLCQQQPDSSRLFPVLWGLWLCYLVRAEFAEARALGEQLVAFAQQAQDPALLLQASNALGTTLYHRGEFPAAREQVERGVSVYRADHHHSLTFLYGGEDPGVVCSCLLALTLWMLGYPDRAEKQLHEADALAQLLRHPFSVADVHGFAAAFYQYRRQPAETLAHAEALLALAETEGFPYWHAAGLMLRGWGFVGQGQREEGERCLLRGLAAHRDAGTELFRPYWLGLLAEVHGQEGRVDESHKVLAEALALIARTGEDVYAAELWRLKGESLLALARRGGSQG
jgi:DNA-binding winged helix-turn-helix (wHTH) protein/predicted ATPase